MKGRQGRRRMEAEKEGGGSKGWRKKGNKEQRRKERTK